MVDLLSIDHTWGKREHSSGIKAQRQFLCKKTAWIACSLCDQSHMWLYMLIDQTGRAHVCFIQDQINTQERTKGESDSAICTLPRCSQFFQFSFEIYIKIFQHLARQMKFTYEVGLVDPDGENLSGMKKIMPYRKK